MQKLNWTEATDYLRRFNREHKIRSKGNNEKAYIVVVITEDSFDVEYSLEARSYLVSSDNKSFIDGMGGYSIFASSLDGSDPCIRLEQYLEAEGNKGGWKIDYCYIKEVL